MSFFYEGRLPVHIWGHCNESVPFSFYPNQASSLAAFLEGFNVSQAMAPVVPTQESGPRRVFFRKWARGASESTAQQIEVQDVPCDKQFPWKKLQLVDGGPQGSTLHGLVGLTIHGELYAWGLPGRQCDIFSAFIGGSGTSSTQYSPNARFYLPFRDSTLSVRTPADYCARPRRIVFPVIDEPIIDVAARGKRNGNAYNVTIVTRSGKVFVAGTLGGGAHGVPPTTTRPDAVRYGFFGGYYAPIDPPFAPIVTEVTLPAGIKAVSVPSGLSNCVIADDGQLYFWWYDYPNNAMRAPQQLSGFVKRIHVTDGGSGYSQGTPPQYTFTAPLVFSESASGVHATGDCNVENGVVVSATVRKAGRGYSSAPTAQVEPPGGPNEVNTGSGASFSCEMFDGSHSFTSSDAVGDDFLIDNNGGLYSFGANSYWDWVNSQEAFHDRILFHSDGPYRFARNGVVISSAGRLYVSNPSLDRFLEIDTVVANRIEGYRFSLSCIGDGYVSGATFNSWDFNGTLYRKYLVAIKTDGTMYSAGKNDNGLLGDSVNLAISRRAMQQIASEARWVDVYCYAGFNPVCVAIRKDAICREIDQPMEFYRDDYYRSLQ
jgi:hypothetical protein